MTFDLTIPQPDGTVTAITLNAGESLFVLGANGTGKSSLMQRFYALHQFNARRISAHRQMWFPSSTIGISPQNKKDFYAQISGQDVSPQARWMDNYSGQRASISLYDLVDAENVRARSIAAAVDRNDLGLAQMRSGDEAPIKTINELLRLSNLSLEISVQENAEIVASRNGGIPYSVAELSDGERNALLIATDVLTAKPGTLILIDEPERHLHRSIISPLLTHLFAKRPDCAFVVSTHEVMLALDNPSARSVLIRGCVYAGAIVSAWEADLVTSEADIDDDLKRDILGARRKLLFIEGDERSLDKPLYTLIFPGVSVIPKASCRDVEHAVSGIRDAEGFHWLQAFGIVDNDRRSQADVDRLKGKGVYAVSVFSVESVYYHPEMQRRAAEAHAAVTGEDAAARLENAKRAAIEAVASQRLRLSARVVESRIRETIFRSLPTQREIQEAVPINVSIDVAAVVSEEAANLQAALDAGDVEKTICRYPVRESPALGRIATELGFRDRGQYEGAVRKLLMNDEGALIFARSLFGALAVDVGIAPQTSYSV